MSVMNGLDVFAAALWKARNKQDPAQDPLAKHLMLQELDQLKDEGRAVMTDLYKEGFVVVRRELYPDTIQVVLKDSIKLFRDPDIAAWMQDCLKRLYVGAVGSNQRNFDNPMIRSLFIDAMAKYGEAHGTGIDKRALEKIVASICTDLAAAGFAVIPREPAKDLMNSALQRDQRGSKLALVFGDDPENIASLYRQIVGRQRIA